MSDPIRLVLLGGLIASCFFAAVFFMRFWHRTRDRFHLFFAAAMLLLSVNCGAVAGTTAAGEAHHEIYLVRLLAFVLILIAIVDRNRRK
jgi:Ni/Fe-hydrogenase subunit HybB-like protein